MIVEDQSQTIAFLTDPASHGGAEPVEVIQTHAAVVFLVGETAYKLKRAVKFPFLDFSTVSRRKTACEEEVRLNRRTAPDLYQGVTPVTRGDDGTLRLAGAGPSVDWLVMMRRFDQDMLLDRMATRGELSPQIVRDLADAIVAFHRAAMPRRDHGGMKGVANVVESTVATLRDAVPDVLDADQVSQLCDGWKRCLGDLGALLEARRAGGMVRWCHGDLHLRNVCLIDGRPTPFDGIEFNEAIACIDVLYDLAFVLMDLGHRDCAALASVLFNRYVAQTEDFGGLPLLPFFLSLRAGVRAMVAAIEAGEDGPDSHGDKRDEARAYGELALRYLRPTLPRMVAIGGLSGSGKSTLAHGLADKIGAFPGAVVVRSDLVRKHLLGVQPETRLPPEAYRSAVNAEVYAHMLTLARRALVGGRAVIVDAVFADPAERCQVEETASRLGIRFDGFWLDAPPALLAARVARRKHDPSDATVAVVRQQNAYETGQIDWWRLDAGRPPDDVISAATNHLNLSAARAGEL